MVAGRPGAPLCIESLLDKIGVGIWWSDYNQGV